MPEDGATLRGGLLPEDAEEAPAPSATEVGGWAQGAASECRRSTRRPRPSAPVPRLRRPSHPAYPPALVRIPGAGKRPGRRPSSARACPST
eukprot:scaffold81945_cov63-Phaeocystis_antarctica.AAC.5